MAKFQLVRTMWERYEIEAESAKKAEEIFDNIEDLGQFFIESEPADVPYVVDEIKEIAEKPIKATFILETNKHIPKEEYEKLVAVVTEFTTRNDMFVDDVIEHHLDIEK